MISGATQPCTPENRLSCGEADAYTFLLLGGILLSNLIAGAVLQFMLWILYRRGARPANAPVVQQHAIAALEYSA